MYTVREKKNIAKFPDFIVSGIVVDFNVSKTLLYSSSAFFRSVLDQSPDLSFCRVELAVPDQAVYLVLSKMHGQYVDIKSDSVLDCLQLALKWNVDALKDVLTLRMLGLINVGNAAKVQAMGAAYGAKELTGATPALGGWGASDMKLAEVERTMKEQNAKLCARCALLEQQMENAFVLMHDKLQIKQEEAKAVAEKKKAELKTPWKDSQIMSLEQARLLKTWTQPNKKAQVKLHLLYRGSRDGFTAKAFHSRCDNVGPTVVVIQSHLGKIFGGFAAAAWTSDAQGIFVPNDRSFTFSITSKTQCNVCGSAKQQFALYHHAGCGPVFGQGHDIHIANDCNLPTSGNYTNGGETYTLPYAVADKKTFYAGVYTFAVKEIEVYQADIILNHFPKK